MELLRQLLPGGRGSGSNSISFLPPFLPLLSSSRFIFPSACIASSSLYLVRTAPATPLARSSILSSGCSQRRFHRNGTGPPWRKGLPAVWAIFFVVGEPDLANSTRLAWDQLNFLLPTPPQAQLHKRDDILCFMFAPTGFMEQASKISISFFLRMDRHVFKVRQIVSTFSSCVDIADNGGGIFSGTSVLPPRNALNTAGFMPPRGAFLSGSCGLSVTGDLLTPLFVGAFLLPKTSLHLGTTLTRDSTVGKQLLLFASPSCSPHGLFASLSFCFQPPSLQI